jgi:hypothetical protein
VRRLLDEGRVSVHETTEEGESLLSLACSAGYYELAQVRHLIMSREKSSYCQLLISDPHVYGPSGSVSQRSGSVPVGILPFLIKVLSGLK